MPAGANSAPSSPPRPPMAGAKGSQHEHARSTTRPDRWHVVTLRAQARSHLQPIHNWGVLRTLLVESIIRLTSSYSAGLGSADNFPAEFESEVSSLQIRWTIKVAMQPMRVSAS